MKKIWYPVVMLTDDKIGIDKREGLLFELEGIKFAVQPIEAPFGTAYSVTHLGSGILVLISKGTVKRAICEVYKHFETIKKIGITNIHSPAETIKRYKKYGERLGLDEREGNND